MSQSLQLLFKTLNWWTAQVRREGCEWLRLSGPLMGRGRGLLNSCGWGPWLEEWPWVGNWMGRRAPCLEGNWVWLGGWVLSRMGIRLGGWVPCWVGMLLGGWVSCRVGMLLGGWVPWHEKICLQLSAQVLSRMGTRLGGWVPCLSLLSSSLQGGPTKREWKLVVSRGMGLRENALYSCKVDGYTVR